MFKVLHCKLITYKIDPGDYTIYVFKNLDYKSIYDKYIMCTKHPDWQTGPIQKGQEGFLKIKEIEAGKDTWYDFNSGDSYKYKYDGVQFYDFILDIPNSEEVVMI